MPLKIALGGFALTAFLFLRVTSHPFTPILSNSFYFRVLRCDGASNQTQPNSDQGIDFLRRLLYIALHTLRRFSHFARVCSPLSRQRTGRHHSAQRARARLITQDRRVCPTIHPQRFADDPFTSQSVAFFHCIIA